MKLPCAVRFADEKTKNAFEALASSGMQEQKLHHFLSQAFENISKDAFCGIQVPKKQIPKEYLQKYGIDNLWKYNLPGAWRLLYSVGRDEVTVMAIVLEWMKHKEYERKFGY